MENRLFLSIVKVSVLVMLFLIAITAFFNYFSYMLAKENLVDSYKTIKMDQMRELAARLERDVARPLEMLIKLAGHTNECETQECRNLTSRIYLEADYAKDITYIDRKGIVEFAYPEDQGVIGSDVSGEDYFRLPMETNRHSITLWKNSGNMEIVISAPLFGRDGSLDGVVSSRLDLEKMLDVVLGSVNSGKNPDYVMLDDDRWNILYHMDKSLIGLNFGEVVGREKYPELWKLHNESLYNEEGGGFCTYESHKKGEYAGEKDVMKLAIYTSVHINGQRWILWDMTPIDEMDSLSGLAQVRLAFYFNVFMLIALLAVSAAIFFLMGKTHVLGERRS